MQFKIDKKMIFVFFQYMGKLWSLLDEMFNGLHKTIKKKPIIESEILDKYTVWSFMSFRNICRYYIYIPAMYFSTEIRCCRDGILIMRSTLCCFGSIFVNNQN